VLLEARADVDGRDRVAETPLHLAAQYGHDDVVSRLLAAKANVNARRNGGLTPLHLASGHGRFRVAKRLLAAGADVNAREDGDWTPLHRAASEGHDNLVRLLLDAGGDPRAADRQGSTPLQYAVLNRHRAAIDLLTARGVGGGGEVSGAAALGLAARDGHPDGVRLFLSKGVPVDAPDANGLTPLHRAISRRPGGSSDWETVRLAEQHEVVALLLAAGANTEVRGRDGNRPLHSAAMFGRVEIAEMLIARGAQIDARNDWKWTPLHYAATQHQPAMVQLLLDRGADIHARNSNGRTALGEISGDPQIENLLKSHGASR
jgi:ankyrin repeat protein